jgi:hypothetical protein
MIKIKNNTILKDEEEIGTITDGIAKIPGGKISNQDKGAIRKAVGDSGLKFDLGTTEATDDEEANIPDTDPPTALVTPPAKVVGGPVSQYNVPVGQDPRLGTKTPGWKKGGE